MTDASTRFRQLPRAEQAQAVRRLHAAGHCDTDIAAATGLCCEQIRALIGQYFPTLEENRGAMGK